MLIELRLIGTVPFSWLYFSDNFSWRPFWISLLINFVRHDLLFTVLIFSADTTWRSWPTRKERPSWLKGWRLSILLLTMMKMMSKFRRNLCLSKTKTLVGFLVRWGIVIFQFYLGLIRADASNFCRDQQNGWHFFEKTIGCNLVWVSCLFW
jgi:hypothetical protein